MGTLAKAHAKLIEQYGTLGVRFNTFREFYDCVVEQVNEHKAPETCL